VPEQVDEPRIKYGFQIIRLATILIAAIFWLVYGIPIVLGNQAPSDLSTALTAVTGTIGTLVGFFLAIRPERQERRKLRLPVQTPRRRKIKHLLP
jgi:uncharacterized membrane protein YbhN (UPF0104 family)